MYRYKVAKNCLKSNYMGRKGIRKGQELRNKKQTKGNMQGFREFWMQGWRLGYYKWHQRVKKLRHTC